MTQGQSDVNITEQKRFLSFVYNRSAHDRHFYCRLAKVFIPKIDMELVISFFTNIL